MIDDQVLQQAADWFAVLQDEAVTADEQRQWQQWLAEDPQHQLAWEQIEQIFGVMSHFDQEADRQVANHVLSSSGHGMRNTLAVVSMLFMSVALGWLTFSPYSLLTGAYHYRTEVGETRQIRLDDGSVLWINTDSEVLTRYDNSLRKITLRSGEILIDSAPDTRTHTSSGSNPLAHSRPLVVDTDSGRLTALGTRFSVKYEDNGTELNVFDGAVRIDPASSNQSHIVRAGGQGHFSPDQIQPGQGGANALREAWSQGLLIADDMPLCQFVSELGRYRSETLYCPSELNRLKLTGTYPLRDTDAILVAIESSLPVRIRQVDDQIWRVEARYQK